MKREELEKLELSKEVIDQIMAMNGKDIESSKSKIAALETELQTHKEQLAEANKAIDDFKSMDIEGVKKSAEEYKAKFEKAEADAKAQLEKLKYDHALEGALAAAKAKNNTAVKSLLNLSDIKLTEAGEFVGLNEQLEKIKTENDYLFESDEKPPRIVAGGNNKPIADDAILAAVRRGAGLSESKEK